jgi:hypothetical protein
MLSATFIGEVRQGQLHIGQPLADFDGKQVLVTLIAQDPPLPQPAPPVPPEESPVELDVEVEVHAPMPITAENLGPRPVRTVAAKPCLIFPEGTADE